MPWAQRGQHRYFFRKQKVRGRVVRRSLGRGPEAQLAAALAAQRQRARGGVGPAAAGARPLGDRHEDLTTTDRGQ
jgi:hypothetical protein